MTPCTRVDLNKPGTLKVMSLFYCPDVLRGNDKFCEVHQACAMM
jgi:hypothetical protein